METYRRERIKRASPRARLPWGERNDVIFSIIFLVLLFFACFVIATAEKEQHPAVRAVFRSKARKWIYIAVRRLPKTCRIRFDCIDFTAPQHIRRQNRLMFSRNEILSASAYRVTGKWQVEVHPFFLNLSLIYFFFLTDNLLAKPLGGTNVGGPIQIIISWPTGIFPISWLGSSVNFSLSCLVQQRHAERPFSENGIRNYSKTSAFN